jgi:cytidyltransferase-like protein
MGALHAGHASLIEIAKKHCEEVVVSIFVNPLQFENPNDFSNYPKSVSADIELAKASGATKIWVPTFEEIYPGDPEIIASGEIGNIFEGVHRFGHFDGMLTVVKRLFDLVQPENIMSLTKAHFGNKMTNVHLSFTNKKRIAINEEMMLKAVKANNSRKQVLELKKLSYDDNSQDVELLSGMPVIARKNCEASYIANNETFTIKEIRHKKQIIVIEDDERKIKIAFKDFQYMFYVAYCITVHKSQGSTYNQPYTIHEWNNPKFDDRLKYVALSRSTNKDNNDILY